MLNLVKLEHFSNLFVSDYCYSVFQDLSFSQRVERGTFPPATAESVDGAFKKPEKNCDVQGIYKDPT